MYVCILNQYNCQCFCRCVWLFPFNLIYYVPLNTGLKGLVYVIFMSLLCTLVIQSLLIWWYRAQSECRQLFLQCKIYFKNLASICLHMIMNKNNNQQIWHISHNSLTLSIQPFISRECGTLCHSLSYMVINNLIIIDLRLPLWNRTLNPRYLWSL